MTLLTKGYNIIKKLSGSSYLLEIDKLTEEYDNLIIILDNNHQIDALYNELKSLFKEKNILKFPDYGLEPYDLSQIDKTVIRDRYECFIKLNAIDTKKIIIATYKSVFYRVPLLNDVSKSWKRITKQSNYNELIDLLTSFGYQKTSKVEEFGQYRISGSIIDFFSIISNKPIRINFFEDKIETIKEFDPISQISSNEIDEIIICTNAIYNIQKSNIDIYLENIENFFDDEYKHDIEYERIVHDRNNSYIHNLIPILFDHTDSLLSSFNDDFACFLQKDIISEFNEQYDNLNEAYLQENMKRYILDPETLLVKKETLERIYKDNYFYQISDHTDANVKTHSEYNSIPNLSINYNYKNPFINFEKFFNNSQYKYIFFIKRDDNFRTLTNYFNSKQVSYTLIDDIKAADHKVQILRSDINEGFINNASKTVFISSSDLFGIVKARVSSKESIKASVIDNLSDLKVNDFVVHQDHGIGKYKGLITMDIENKTTELMKIEYAENNNLYMPVTSMMLIQKYIGNTSINTKLSQLGSDKWHKIKQRAKRKIDDIAVELLRVQAKRELSNGYKFSLDNLAYDKFCSLFPYVETDDQLNTINDVISDMCSIKSMDRVVCGDVGFGKTEVILRASFIAANNDKQVVIIVPTTVLAKQHFETFKRRFAKYSHNISIVTRATSRPERLSIINKLYNNQIHILIGTHALLNKDFKCADLGLLIIDEEHKFGVKHKESIKQIKENIDVLALTATPIPRTLSSTLSEIKDMSIINTPPVGRKNIETAIINKSDDNLNRYIQREITRGGQVLYIHNNIETMDDEINLIKKCNKNIIIEKVHGRLSNNEIEKIMNSFLDEQINILVCTSIIESGLDMTNVNTIIINNAQNFGLSQLHQLRGRVGRSNKQAYAALILCDQNNFTKDAEKRIDAFVKTKSLAGGIEIAGHDLEIRGAGEILGEEQSGQIFEIGYAMYTSMLSKAIKQLKNHHETNNHIHTDVDCYISTLIPQDYVEDIFLRLEIYNDISNAKNDYDINHIVSKLEDVYGPIPDYLKNLFSLTRVKIEGNRIKADKIKINKENTVITLNPKSLIDNDKLINHFVLKNKIKLTDQYNLKYQNISKDNFCELCEEVISMMKDVSD